MNLISKSLYLVSTPIGNLNDITIRAVEILKKSDIILCEDTRHSAKLLNHLKIKKKTVPYHKYNEKKQLPNIIKYLNDGKILSIISDAGTPTLSDPGNLLVNECIKNRINIIPIPGASSITAAVSISGFDQQFIFIGFLPKTENELEKVLKKYENLDFALVFFISGVKINFYLKKFKKNLSGRKILIAREITKIHESFYREEVNKIELFKAPLKGEMTVVISNKINKVKSIAPIDNLILKKQAAIYLKKYSLKDVVELLAKKENLSKKRVYNMCLEIKKNEKNI